MSPSRIDQLIQRVEGPWGLHADECRDIAAALRALKVLWDKPMTPSPQTIAQTAVAIAEEFYAVQSIHTARGEHAEQGAHQELSALDLMGEIAHIAEETEKLFLDLVPLAPDEPGVWAYEVVGPLGSYLGDTYLTDPMVLYNWEPMLGRLVAEFYDCGHEGQLADAIFNATGYRRPAPPNLTDPGRTNPMAWALLEDEQ